MLRLRNSSSGGNISPKGSSGSSQHHAHKRTGKPPKYPPPYWQEKIGKNYDVIKLLEHNLDLRYALHKSPTLAGEFMKHPDVSREVARDHKLATEIIRRPHLLEELANFHHYAHEQKRRQKIKEYVKNLERDYIVLHYKDPGGLVIPLMHKDLHRASASQVSMAIARATLPNIATGTSEEPPTVKYIMKSSRLFLRHDISIEHHGYCCINKKVNYYNILNSHGRLLYRVFRRHKQVPDRPRPYELVVKDPDGITICIFAQIKDRHYRRKLSVQYPPHKVIGYVEQKWSLTGKPCFYLKNKEQERMIIIDCVKRPILSHCRYHSQFNWELRAIGAHNVIGKISSEWIDTPPGAFESERIYGVCFPLDLTAEVKINIMAAWILVFINYYQGKLEPCVHHTLTDEELALIRLVENSSDDDQHGASHEPSSDSDDDKDQAVINHYRRSFEVATISAKKRIGVDNLVDVNRND